MLTLVLALAAAPQDTDNPAVEPAPLLGGCVQRRPVAQAPSELRAVSGVVATDAFGPLPKKLTAFGIVLAAEEGVSDEFLALVGTAIAEVFRAREGIEPELQEAVIRHLYEYRALLPVPRTEDSFERLFRAHSEALERVQHENSLCDIVMAEVPEGQVMEVVEHVLHTVTDVGLHYEFPREWGLSREPQLWRAMMRAVELGYYDIGSYTDLEGEEEEVRDRVLLQEFAYWFVSTAWDLQEPYGPQEPEWTIRDSNELKSKLPEFYAVFERTAARVLSSPLRSTLAKIGPTRAEERGR